MSMRTWREKELLWQEQMFMAYVMGFITNQVNPIKRPITTAHIRRTSFRFFLRSYFPDALLLNDKEFDRLVILALAKLNSPEKKDG